MKISTRGRYGVRALLDIACKGTGEPEKARDIARRQEIPVRYLEQIFQLLKKGGLLGTRRGARGGYYLNRDPSEITVAEIVRITDGPLVPVACEGLGNKGRHCHRSERCAMRPVWDEAGRLMMEYLQSVTLADLCHGPRPGGD